MKKILIGLLILLAILLAIYAILSITKNQNTTTNGTTANDCTDCATVAGVQYVNNDYGFKIVLPETWQGYAVITSTWVGYNIEQVNTESGPEISLRHPLWTSANPRQDIPVMIFTIKQWNDLQNDKFHIGAAPIGPSELDRNSKYVFALPARYNFAFLTGFEEVDTIVRNNSLTAFDI